MTLFIWKSDEHSHDLYLKFLGPVFLPIEMDFPILAKNNEKKSEKLSTLFSLILEMISLNSSSLNFHLEMESRQSWKTEITQQNKSTTLPSSPKSRKNVRREKQNKSAKKKKILL